MKKGFTLIELLISITLISLLLAAAVPFSINFLRRENLASTKMDVISVLRRAQNKAMTGEGDTNWGVRFTAGEYILYGSYEEDYDYPNTINISASDVVFQKLTGLTTPTVITLDTETISINSHGLIE